MCKTSQLSLPFLSIEEEVVRHLEGLEAEARLECIDDLLHRLMFERRFMLLTDKERQHMHSSLSAEQREALDDAGTEEEREKLIQMYARADYFRECAWREYLNGETDEKPFSSEQTELALSQ